MAFELITGHAGRNHVDSADMGEAFAGIVGKGRYILDTGDGMACSMADSNTLTVGTGSMLMDGRIVRNETAATFKIANGTQGQYRHDLACLRYTLDRSNDSIESVEQVVLQGTPATTASGAKDPEYEAGDILSGDLSATVPIARVKLDNLTPTCEAMLGSVTSLKSLGESVSQEQFYWLYLDEKYGQVVFYARGGIATLTVIDINQVDPGAPWKIPEVIPREFRPEFSFYNPLVHRQSNNIGQIWIPSKTTDDDHLYVYAGVSTHTSANGLNGTVTWIYTEPTDLEPDE